MFAAGVGLLSGMSGTMGAVVAGALNGAIIGAAVGAITAAVNGTNILEGMGKGALMGAVTGAVAGGIGEAFKSAEAITQVDAGVGGATEAGGQQLAAGSQELAAGIQGPPVPAGVLETGLEVTPAVPVGEQLTQNQYLKTLTDMQAKSQAFMAETGKKAFYREAASGALQAGFGAYATGKETEEMAALRAKEIEESRGSGVLARTHKGAVVDPSYAASKPRVVAPVAARPTATRVGVEAPTPNIRDISVQQGVLPNA